MDGTILLLDYSNFEREKLKYIFGFIGDFDFLEIPSINEYYPMMDKFKDITLIILDLEFPYAEEGFEILASLRKNVGFSIPIIIISKTDSIENRNLAQKFTIYDFILKPYNATRLEKSIRSIINIKKDFHYSTSEINKFTMSFDELVSREIAISDTVKLPLTIIFVTPVKIKAELSSPSTEESSSKVFKIASKTIKPLLSITDSFFTNKNKDIIVLLPFTDAAYAKLCVKKINSSLTIELNKESLDLRDFLTLDFVTYPEDGSTFQDLIRNFFEKIANGDSQKESENITDSAKENASKKYNQFKKWY